MISLKDVYFNRILDGSKLTEFRRAFTKKLENDFLCVIYVSSPIKSIMGIVKFQKPIFDSTQNILEMAKNQNYPWIGGVSDYLEGKEKSFALLVKKVIKFKEPVQLEEIRKIQPGFRPPQSFYNLSKEQFSNLKRYILKHEAFNEII